MLSRVFRVGTTLVVLGLMTANAHAQGGRGGAGGRMAMPRGGTASDLLPLLASPEVRKEVGLSDEGAEAVNKVLKEAEEARAAAFGGRGPGGPGGPGAGGPGAGGPGGPGAGGPGGFNREQMQQRMAEMQKKIDEAVLGALSDSQKKSLEELKGAKFEFPESLRNSARGMGGMGGFAMGGFGRGGAPGGERGDRGERGNRDGGDRGNRGEGGRGEGGRGPGGGFDFEAMRKQREEAAQKAQDLLDEVLPPEGMDRLIGLYVQLRGNTSITGELPAKKLGLTEDDIAKVNEAMGSAMREAFQGFGGGGGGRGRPNSDSGT